MHANYKVSISYGSKVIAKVKVDNRQVYRQADRTKTIYTPSFDPGHKNFGHINIVLLKLGKLYRNDTRQIMVTFAFTFDFKCTFYKDQKFGP